MLDMRKRLIAFFVAVMAVAAQSVACTSVIVGKDASVDGSVMCTYSCDSYGTFHPMYHFPAAKHGKGEMLKIYDRDTRVYHGEIPEAPITYNVVGNMNEWQVTIGETTFGGRSELIDTTGIMDYGSLMNVALQRSKTAREAIGVMTTIAETYGFNSSDESFTICDPNEAWIMEMVGCGIGSKAVAWVAVRIPDNAISAHANHTRIHKFDQKDKKNVMFSKNCIKFAREKGWYTGKDADFSFSKAYSPADFGKLRYCEARVWSFFNHFADGFDKYLSYAMGENPDAEPMPLWVVPNEKLGVQDVLNVLRDHYEGTPMALDNDPGQGIYEAPYRPTPLSYEYNGKKYFNERPISTQQSAFVWIGQMRAHMPREVGGVLWFANDDSNMVPFTPVYCCNTDVPACYKEEGCDAVTFSMDNAFWVCNWVSNMVYPRYSMMMPTLAAVRDSLQTDYLTNQPKIEAEALALQSANPYQAVAFLTAYSNEKGAQMLSAWRNLATKLIVKFNDGLCKTEKDGKYQFKKGGFQTEYTRPGYGEKTTKFLIEQTGDRFAIPAWSESKH